jgi:hypothetical protein
MNFGPVCFKRLLDSVQRGSRKVDLRASADPGELLNEFFFDRQGEADLAAMVGATP